MQRNAQFFIEKLDLIRHVEGGWYRETYRSSLQIKRDGLPDSFSGPRNISTSIYFLLENKVFSAFHKIKSDETWHFYSGNGLVIYELENNGELREHLLGPDPEKGQSFQVVVKAGNWFASAVLHAEGYALCGCTVSPGFDFADFEMADRDQLLSQFPGHAGLIRSFCR